MPSISRVIPKPNEHPSRRPKIKARRKLVSHSYICVLDTNVILDDLNAIKSLIAEHTSPSTSDKSHSISRLIYKIIVPMVVLQELDGIKMSTNRPKTLTNIAQNAIKFINEQLMLKNKLQGEPDKNPENRMSECILPVENNDDRILDCCIRLSELFSDKTVILLTNDINLQNKAATWKIEATSMDFFKMKHKGSTKAFTNGKSKCAQTEQVIESVEEEVPKPKRHKLNSKVSSNKRNSITSNSTTLPSKPDLTTSNSKAVKAHTPGAIQKVQLETVLIKFIVDQLEKQYGKTWVTIFNKFNPKIATLTDSLKMLKSNWLGVFSDCFKRDTSVLEIIKSLLDAKNAKNSSSMNQLYSKLFSKINKFV